MFDILTRHGASAAGDYEIERSLRHNSGDSTYMSRTPSSTSNRRTFTFSFWVKEVTSSGGAFFGVWQDNTSRDVLRFESGNINLQCGQHSENATTTAVYRDVSAWYHIVCAVDSTQASSGDRVVIYVNGVSQALGTNTISQNRDFKINTNNLHVIGCRWLSDAYHSGFDGYIAEFNFIDGAKVAASSFGETNADTGQWIPKKYAGSYGTNGYYLKFTDNSGTSATTLGKDYSGNGNNFTPNNYSVAAAPANDSVVDTPTDNFCTWNALTDENDMVLANGSLNATNTTDSWPSVYGTIGASSGKFYFEATNTDQTRWGLGWSPTSYFEGNSGSFADGYFAYSQDPLTRYATGSGSAINGNPAFTTSDVLQVAIDIGAGKIWYGIDNTWVNDDSGNAGNPAAGTYPINTFTAGTEMFPKLVNNKGNVSVNWGQQGFAFTPPSGFETLSTANLATPTIKNPSKYFNTGTYTGTGSSNAITGLGFQPDKVVVKMRNTADQDFQVFDAVRGANKVLRWNTQETSDTQTTRFTSFDSDGFTVGTENITNQSSKNFVYWAWKESATAGFDMVSYTGDGNTPRNISHSLGAVPELMIVKNLSDNSTRWIVYNKTMDADENMFLNSVDDDENLNNYWASTRPTSSVFTVMDGSEVNGDGKSYINYLWTSVEGMCKVGTYSGNSSNNGIHLNMGFRPSFFLVKNTNDNAAWILYDDARGSNSDNPYIVPSGYNNMVELNDVDLDIVSNGIKFRYAHNNTNYTENGSAYIYLAMARSPFKYANAR